MEVAAMSDENPFTALALFCYVLCAVHGFILLRCLYEKAE